MTYVECVHQLILPKYYIMILGSHTRFLRGWLGEPEIMPLKTLIALSQWSCQVSMILAYVSKKEGKTHD